MNTRIDAHLQHGSELDVPHEPFVVERGLGSEVWDTAGRRYLDAHGGAWLSQIGHGRPEMAAVAARQLATLEHFTTRREFATPPAIALADAIVELSALQDGAVRFSNAGSEADDDALQVVREYQRRRGLPDKRVVITLVGAFHGHTIGGLQLGGQIPVDDVVQVRMPDPYAFEGSPAELVEVCVAELEETIARIGADRIAAMFGEPVFGPAGMFAPPADYWPRAVAVLRSHDILFVADEVVTGFGRAGAMFGCDLWGVVPDIMVFAKGLTSGYAAVAAVLLSREIADVTRGFSGGGSFSGHALGTALALENLRIVVAEGLAENAAQRGRQFLAELEPLLELPAVTAVHGAGLMVGVRLDEHAVAALERPLDETIRKEHGVILMSSRNRLVITPPLVFTAAEVSETVAAVAAACRGIPMP
ncbi:MAG: aminotransferase class III-fold pyridoxal phosphate-dependent enzyme [Microbacteriaceae bacterium]